MRDTHGFADPPFKRKSTFSRTPPTFYRSFVHPLYEIYSIFRGTCTLLKFKAETFSIVAEQRDNFE